MNSKKEDLFFIRAKKGMSHDLFFNLFEMVLALIVGLALFNFVTDVSERTIFEKNYIARDLSLLINILYAAPGDLEYKYSEEISKFPIDISEGRIKVAGGEKDASAETFYLFGENRKIPITKKTIFVEQGSNLQFIKSENLLEVKTVKNENK